MSANHHRLLTPPIYFVFLWLLWLCWCQFILSVAFATHSTNEYVQRRHHHPNSWNLERNDSPLKHTNSRTDSQQYSHSNGQRQRQSLDDSTSWSVASYPYIQRRTFGVTVDDGQPRIKIAAFITDPYVEAIVNPNYTQDYAIQGADFIDAWSEWTSLINQRGGIAMHGFSSNTTERALVSMDIYNVGYGSNANDVTKVMNVTNTVLADRAFGYYPLALGPFSTAYVIAFNKICEATGTICLNAGSITDTSQICPYPALPSVAPDCIDKAPYARRFANTFSNSVQASGLAQSCFIIMKYLRAQNVAFISANDVASTYMYASEVVDAKHQGMNILLAQIINSTVPGNPSNNDILSLLQQLLDSEQSIDAIFFNSASSAECILFAQALQQLNVLPKLIGLNTCPPSYTLFNALKSLNGMNTLQWAISGGQWHPALHYTVSPTLYPDQLFPSTTSRDPTTGFEVANSDAVQGFTSYWNDTYDTIPDSSVALAMFVAVTAQMVFEQINVNISDPTQAPTAIRNILANLNVPTAFGTVQYDTNGVYNGESVVYQWTGKANGLELIYPFDSATSSAVYPLPTFQERQSAKLYFLGGVQYPSGYSSRALEIAGVVLNSVCMVGVIILFAITWFYRNSTPFKATSRRFSYMVLCGCFMMLTANFCWTLYETDATCSAHIWLFCLGYMVMYTPLFARTYRLYRVFDRDELKVLQMDDSRLFFQSVVPFLLVELALLIIWQILGDFHAILIVVDPIRPVYNFQACEYNSYSNIMLGIVIGYKAAALVVGSYLIFKARHVPGNFNEATPVGIAIYNALFFAIILLPLLLTSSLSRDTAYIVRTFAIIAAIAVTLITLFVPKILKSREEIELGGPIMSRAESDVELKHLHSDFKDQDSVMQMAMKFNRRKSDGIAKRSPDNANNQSRVIGVQMHSPRTRQSAPVSMYLEMMRLNLNMSMNNMSALSADGPAAASSPVLQRAAPPRKREPATVTLNNMLQHGNTKVGNEYADLVVPGGSSLPAVAAANVSVNENVVPFSPKLLTVQEKKHGGGFLWSDRSNTIFENSGDVGPRKKKAKRRRGNEELDDRDSTVSAVHTAYSDSVTLHLAARDAEADAINRLARAAARCGLPVTPLAETTQHTSAQQAMQSSRAPRNPSTTQPNLSTRIQDASNFDDCTEEKYSQEETPCIHFHTS